MTFSMTPRTLFDSIIAKTMVAILETLQEVSLNHQVKSTPRIEKKTGLHYSKK